MKAKGFHDVESQTSDGNTELVNWDRAHFQRYYDESQAAYWAKAEEFLKTFQFRTKADRLIWRMHCEGFNAPEIGRRVQRLPHSVRRTILQLRRKLRHGLKS